MNAAPELLEAAAQGDEQACEQMLRENSGLIWSIVRRYYGRGVEPDDLYQLGCLGFIKAIKGFDFAFGTQFSTYAVPKIAGEIRRFLRDDGAIKVSRSMREQAATIFAAREKLKNTLGREPALSELSEETGFNAEEIAQCELAVAAPDSLQRETSDGLTLEGMLGGESPEDGLIERIALREAIERWYGAENYTHIMIRHAEVDSATDAFYAALEPILTHDADAAESAIECLKAHLQSIGSMEHVSFRSVF